jgi:hypothetical protein
MRRVVALVVALVLLAVASQVLLPPLLADRVADRLERDGGTAHVSLHAFPALRLLAGHGDRIAVEGRRLRLRLEAGRGGLLHRLDGFGAVDVRLRGGTAGPLRIDRLSVTRPSGGRPYRLALAAATSPRAVARFLGSQAGGGLGGFLGDLAGGILPGGDAPVPIDLDAAIRSSGGRAQPLWARGSVAGLPAGPLAALVVAAIADRL